MKNVKNNYLMKQKINVKTSDNEITCLEKKL